MRKSLPISTIQNLSSLSPVIGRTHQVKELRDASGISTELVYLYLETHFLSNSFSPGAVGSNTISISPYSKRLNTHFGFSGSDISNPLRTWNDCGTVGLCAWEKLMQFKLNTLNTDPLFLGLSENFADFLLASE